MWTSLWVVFRRILFMDPLAPPSVALSVWVILLANVYISLNYFSYSWAIRTCSETKPAKSCPKTHWTGGAISPLQWNQTPLPEFRPFSCSPEYLPVAIGQVSIGKKIIIDHLSLAWVTVRTQFDSHLILYWVLEW